MRYGRIKKVSTTSDGRPVHPYRVGDRVIIHEVYEVPIGSMGEYHMMKDYFVSLQGDDFTQSVTEHDLEEL